MDQPKSVPPATIPSSSETDPTLVAADAPTTDSSAAPASARRTPDTIGRYRVLGRLGEGGMGIVFEAEQEQPRRRVALKVIRGGQFVDEERVRLFQREVDTLARLKHPNIASIYEAGRTESGEHFFAMELVRGRTLADYLSSRPGPLDAAELRFRLRLFLTLCDAVSYAHQRGVIHRDLKPSNIIVSDADGDGAGVQSTTRSGLPELKVLDFGLARITESDLEATVVMSEVGVVRGTLPYMSPEQARGDTDQIDVRSDVYTLGVILQEMLTGKRPYETQNVSLMEAVRVISEQSPVPLRQTWSGSRPPDPDLQTIVGKALEKDVDRRYASVSALAEDVERYLESRPILARAPSTVYQLRKMARRHRTLVAGGAATLVALIAGVVASTTFGLREAAQRRAAVQAQHDTQAVAEFQANMLGGVDARQMGRRLEADLEDRIHTARRAAGGSEAEAAAARGAFQAQMARINATDAAVRVIDENILSQAIATSATQFANRPRIRARLLRSIGQTYSKLGLLERAEPSLLESLSLTDSAGASATPEAFETMRVLAKVYSDEGRAGASESLYVAALAGQRKALGVDHPEVLQTMDELAVLYADNQRYPEAESLYAIVLPAFRRVQGVEDPATLACLNDYAWALITQDKFARAESLAVLAVALRRKVLGNDNQETMTSANNLAVLYVRSGRPERAEPLYLEDLATSRKLLGDEHPDVLVSMTNIGRLYNRMKKYAEAEAWLRKSMVATRKVMPHEFIGLGITLLAHSEALVGLGRDREAEPDAIEAYGILRGLRGDSDPGVQRAVHILVDTYLRTGNAAAAAKWKGKLAKEQKG